MSKALSGGELDEVCHVCFQPVALQKAILSAGEGFFPPPPVLPADSHGVAYAHASEESSGVLSSKMPHCL